MDSVHLENGSLKQGTSQITLKGVNFGSWVNIENFMIGLPAIDSAIRAAFQRHFGPDTTEAFFRCYADNFITEEDVRFVKECGFNLIRLPFNYHYFEDDQRPFEYKEQGFTYIDRFMDWCDTHEVYALLDFHALQGGQNTTPPADNPTGYPLLWTDRCCQDRAIALWQEMARRYRHRPSLLGYDLFNEPITTDPELVNAFYRRLIPAIREIDSEHLLVLEGCVRQSGGISSLDSDLFSDPQAIPSFHYYPLARMADTYPGEHDGTYWDAELLRSSMDTERAYSDALQRPMLLGEFGFNYNRGKPPVMSRVVDDELSTVESFGWHWTLWSYKDVGAMGLLNPKPDTAWRRFVERKDMVDNYRGCLDAFKKMFDSHYIPVFGKTEKNRLIFDDAFNDSYRGWSRVAIDYVVRTLKESYPVEQIVAMPEAFHFDNCRVNQFALDTLMKHLR